LALANYSANFTDVVVNAIIVEQARLDLKDGANDLVSLSWIMWGIGGTIGSVCARFATDIEIP